LPLPDLHFHSSNTFNRRDDDISWLDWAYTLRCAAQNDVAGVQGIERRCVLDQFGNPENQVPGIRLLAKFAVDRDAEIQCARVGKFVCGYEPGTEDCVAVRRLPQAAFFRPANGDVEADAVARYIVERISTRDVARRSANHEGQFHFVIVSAIELAQNDALP